MSAYSINGYVVAVLQRSAKTILVEGSTDKKVMNRLLLERRLSNEKPVLCVVDEVGAMIADQALGGMGNKEKVEHAAAVVAARSAKFNWLVDREWEGINLAALPESVQVISNATHGKKTRGHSIENYWFKSGLIASYLQMFHSDDLPADFFVELEVRFEAMLRIAVAYSFSAHRQSAITRCSSIVRGTDVEWLGQHFRALPSLNAQLASRGLQHDLAAEINQELQSPNIQGASVATLQWLCHGHLGENMLRACTSNLAAAYGVSGDNLEAIERGHHETKLRHHSDQLSKLDREHLEPLAALVDWAAE